MLQVGKIKIRNIEELQDSDVVLRSNCLTPFKKRKNLKSTTAGKNLKEDVADNISGNNNATTETKTARKRLIKSALKETPCNQKRIDSYFTSCPKNYIIKLPKDEVPATRSNSKPQKRKAKERPNKSTITNKKSKMRPKSRRRRLFSDSTEPSTENMSDTSYMKVNNMPNIVECITIDSSDSEEENNVKKTVSRSTEEAVVNKCLPEPACSNENDNQTLLSRNVNSSPITTSSLSFGLQQTKTSCEIIKSEKSSLPAGTRRKAKPCPPYKIIENTTFAVDAFQFGYIENVTHYFLTHFHADHYIGLTKSFAMPIFVSPITARLLRSFIPLEEHYINELDVNQSVVVNNIEITALDANHCPGSIMFLFKFLDTGKCILHTGDFRASHDMESEPIFWNNHIHTIYLDTTYISDKYAFCTQFESIEKAQDLIDKFLAKHCWHRILYICGSYLIGKERFWSSLAEELGLKVWTEGNRSKALKAINDERFNRLLVEDPNEANLHILPMKKLSYLELVEYFKLYEHKYDVLFAIRPSGWEKDTKPRYSSKINLVGIEYSEHSSYAEMERFVKFLKPDQVISTVPSGRNLMKTSSVPQSWYKYDQLKVTSNYQPTIDSFLSNNNTSKKRLPIRLPDANKGGVDLIVSPFKPYTPIHNNELIRSVQVSQFVEIADSNEETCDGNSPETAQNKIFTLTKSTTNSSDDFEKSNFIVRKQTAAQSNKKDVKQNHQKDFTKTKLKRNQKESVPKNNKTKLEALNQIPDNKLKRENKSQTENRPLNFSSAQELNDLETSAMQKRITRSQKSSSMLTNNSSDAKRNQNAESSESTSQKKSKTNSINSKLVDNTSPLTEEFPCSQKRATRSKATSSKTSISNIQRSTKPKSQLKSAINLNNYPVNSILKSNTNSSVERLSHTETHSNSIKSPTVSENLDDFEQLPSKAISNKRPALNCDLTPFKKTKAIFNTQTILNTILEQNADFDRFQCSQLAGLVVETAYQQNPENSKDHIPADLLSDADDDWM